MTVETKDFSELEGHNRPGPELQDDIDYLHTWAWTEYGINLDGGDRPLRRLDELFAKLTARPHSPEENAYLAHLFAACAADRIIRDIGGRWGMTKESGLQVEYVGKRRRLELVKLCAARMLAAGLPLPVEPAERSALLILSKSVPDEVMSFQRLYELLESESDEAGDNYFRFPEGENMVK